MREMELKNILLINVWKYFKTLFFFEILSATLMITFANWNKINFVQIWIGQFALLAK